MFKVLLLAFVFFAPQTARWVKQKDSYRIHWLYVNTYGNTLGDYFQPYPNSGLPVVEPKYTANCSEGQPVEFKTEQEARDYVLRCPLW